MQPQGPCEAGAACVSTRIELRVAASWGVCKCGEVTQPMDCRDSRAPGIPQLCLRPLWCFWEGGRPALTCRRRLRSNWTTRACTPRTTSTPSRSPSLPSTSPTRVRPPSRAPPLPAAARRGPRRLCLRPAVAQSVQDAAAASVAMSPSFSGEQGQGIFPGSRNLCAISHAHMIIDLYSMPDNLSRFKF